MEKIALTLWSRKWWCEKYFENVMKSHAIQLFSERNTHLPFAFHCPVDKSSGWGVQCTLEFSTSLMVKQSLDSSRRPNPLGFIGNTLRTSKPIPVKPMARRLRVDSLAAPPSDSQEKPPKFQIECQINKCRHKSPITFCLDKTFRVQKSNVLHPFSHRT